MPETSRPPQSAASGAIKNATTGMVAGAIGFLAAEAWLVPPLMAAFAGGAESQLELLRSGLPLLGASAAMGTVSYIGSLARDAAARGAGVLAEAAGRFLP